MGLTESKPIQNIEEEITKVDDNQENTTDSSWEIVDESPNESQDEDYEDSSSTSSSMPELEEVVSEEEISVTQENDEKLRVVVEKFVDDIIRDCLVKAEEIKKRSLEPIIKDDVDVEDEKYCESLKRSLEFMDEYPIKPITSITNDFNPNEMLDVIEESEREESSLSNYESNSESSYESEYEESDYIEDLALMAQYEQEIIGDIFNGLDNVRNNLTNFVNKWVKVDELKSFLKLSLLVYVGSSLCGTAM
tara:strand:- start:595 stop:1341 length:747 start_codon:yes stop_codon:yes gene_type:complete